jgi:20S proteasome alpha/beta subunit
MLSVVEQQQDFIQEVIPNQEDLLTTVIGIKCKDGVVIGTDSQFTETTYGTKSLTENKIHRINEFMILGGSGDVYQTNVLVESLQENLSNKQYSDIELREIIMEKVLRPLYKEYNPDPTQRISFYPLSLLAARTEVGCRLYVIIFFQLNNMKRLAPDLH